MHRHVLINGRLIPNGIAQKMADAIENAVVASPEEFEILNIIDKNKLCFIIGIVDYKPEENGSFTKINDVAGSVNIVSGVPPAGYKYVHAETGWIDIFIPVNTFAKIDSNYR
jgi:hypothetical protein